MLTPTQVSNLAQTPSLQHSQEQSVQRARVEGVAAPRQGPVDASHMTARSASAVSEREPARFQPSTSLKKRALELRKDMPEDTLRPRDLSQATTRMVLEGHYLQEAQQHAAATRKPMFISFEQIDRHLGLASRLAEEVEARRTQVWEQLAQISESQKPKLQRMMEVSQCFRGAIEQQIELFAKRTAVYDEVLKQPGLSKEDRTAVLESELSFSIYATKTQLDIPKMVGTVLQKADAITGALERSERNLRDKGMDTRAAALREQVQQWKAVSEELVAIQDELAPVAKSAVDRAGLAHLLKVLNESSGSLGNQAHAFTGQGVRQLGLSGLALGAANSFTEAALEKWPGAQPIVGALATALAHEVGTHLLACSILEVVGGATRPVNAAHVLPSPNPLVSVQGEVRKRRPEELDAERAKVTAKRCEFWRAQNAHKLGSLEGDAKAWTLFAVAQGVLGATSIFAPTDGPGVATLGSMLAGLMMGGIHAVGGLRARVEDERGRSIPAYAVNAAAPATVAGKLKKTGAEGLAKLNYLQEAPRKAVQDKISSLALALASTKALDLATNAVVKKTPASKSAVTGFAAAAKSIVLLSQYWAGIQIGALTKVDAAAKRTAGTQSSGANYDRAGTAWRNITQPNRPAVPHATPPRSTVRLAENAYTVWQGISQLVPTALSDTVESTPGMIKVAAGKIEGSVKSLASSIRRTRDVEGQSTEEHMMVDLEAQRSTTQ